MSDSSSLLNAGLLTEAVILEAQACITGQAALTPSGLYAVNSLVEAVVLHDHVLLGLMSIAGGRYAPVEQMQRELGSEIAQIPELLQFEEKFPDGGGGYAQILHWISAYRHAVNSAEAAELANFGVIGDYLRVEDITPLLTEGSFEKAFGVRSESGRHGTIVDPPTFKAFTRRITDAQGKPISPNDIVAIQELGWQAAAARSIAATLDVELYPSLMERPFYFDLLRKLRGPLQLVQEIKKELSLADLWLGEIEIPPFVGMALRDVKGELGRFWEAVVELRNRHSGFRGSLTEFRKAWGSAKTLKEQRQLLLSHESAWNALLQKEDYRKTKRLTYVLGRAATSLGKSLMDDAIELDRFDQALNQVGGLVKLWDDARGIPTTKESGELLRRLFRDVASPAHWRRVRLLTEAMETVSTGSE